MDDIKKDLKEIYSHVSAPKASATEYQTILAKVRSSVATKTDKIKFSLVFATMIFAILFISSSNNGVEVLDHNQNIYIYNFSNAFDPN